MSSRAWMIGPALVAVIMTSTMIGGAALIYYAHADPSFAVESDYYEKAVRWDEAAAQARRNAALGWIFDVEPALGSAEVSGSVRIVVVDRDGVPVERAVVRVETFHNARASERLTLELREVGPGVYEREAPIERPGLWELRVDVRKGDARFTAAEQVWVDRVAGSER